MLFIYLFFFIESSSSLSSPWIFIDDSDVKRIDVCVCIYTRASVNGHVCHWSGGEGGRGEDNFFFLRTRQIRDRWSKGVRGGREDVWGGEGPLRSVTDGRTKEWDRGPCDRDAVRARARVVDRARDIPFTERTLLVRARARSLDRFSVAEWHAVGMERRWVSVPRVRNWFPPPLCTRRRRSIYSIRGGTSFIILYTYRYIMCLCVFICVRVRVLDARQKYYNRKRDVTVRHRRPRLACCSTRRCRRRHVARAKTDDDPSITCCRRRRNRHRRLTTYNILLFILRTSSVSSNYTLLSYNIILNIGTIIITGWIYYYDNIILHIHACACREENATIICMRTARKCTMNHPFNNIEYIRYVDGSWEVFFPA